MRIVAARGAGLHRGLSGGAFAGFERGDGEAGLEAEAVGVAEELFDADRGDAAFEQVADGGLVFVEQGDELGLGVACGADVFEEGGENLCLDLEGGGSEAEKPRASKMLALMMWVGLVSAGVFIGAVLLDSLSYFLEALGGHVHVPSICLAAILLEAVEHVDDVAHFREIEGPVPCAFVRFLQIVNAGADGLMLRV